jgi:hypothetical protein
VTACFHPETTSSVNYNIKNLNIFIRFLKSIDANIVFTFPNADTGFNEYIKLITTKLNNRKNIKLIELNKKTYGPMETVLFGLENIDDYYLPSWTILSSFNST